jgi:hypothetical protein
MKKFTILFLLTISINLFSNAQVNCSGGRYLDSLFAVDTIKDVLYGSNINYDGTTRQLKLDIYLPQSDTATNRPLIIFAPKGSFMQEDKAELALVTLCKAFASRGYVAASIDYRVGMDYLTAYQFPEREYTYALMRAIHDYRAAIRFFRQDAATANIYKINPNLIIAGGSSAGAMTALHVAYLDKESELPVTIIDTTGLGGLEGNSGNPGYSSHVNFVVNLCGAINDSAWIETGDIPLISMHGNLDTEVPFGTASISMIVPITEVDGSASINLRCQHLAIENPFYIFWGQAHIPYDTNAGGQFRLYMDTVVTFTTNHIYNWICGGNAGIEENSANNTTITIAPNPFTDQTMISVSIEMKNASLVLTDITGRETERFDNLSGNNFTLQKKNLRAGIYFYHLIDGKNLIGAGKLAVQ